MKYANVALGLLIAISLAATACSQAPGPPTPQPSNPFDPAAIRYSCVGPPAFLPALFDEPGAAEREDHPSAESLRAFLAADRMGMSFLPDAGWWLVERDQQDAQYIARLPDGNESPFGEVTMHLAGGTWSFAGGGNCRPVVVLDGLSPTLWAFALDQPIPDRSTVEFRALVTEWACAGGEPVGPRLLPPWVTYTDDSILVVFAARRSEGLSTCPGIPPSPALVRLREPLGDRKLLDAGAFPYHDPKEPMP